MNERETELLTASNIKALRLASLNVLENLKLDREAITNIWNSIVTEHERLSEKTEQKEAAKR